MSLVGSPVSVAMYYAIFYCVERSIPGGGSYISYAEFF